MLWASVSSSNKWNVTYTVSFYDEQFTVSDGEFHAASCFLYNAKEDGTRFPDFEVRPNTLHAFGQIRMAGNKVVYSKSSRLKSSLESFIVREGIDQVWTGLAVETW